MRRWQIEQLAGWRWPETKTRKSSPFRSTVDQTMVKLMEECDRLDMTGTLAIHVVTESPDDVRQDGMLRARARATHPGVAVSFVSRLGALTYPCDVFFSRRYGQPDWQINLRAIALGLEALRQLDRYGMVGQQYAGYLALPASSGALDESLDTVQGAEKFLRDLADEKLRNSPLLRVWRAVSVQTHPDTNGGESYLWDKVQRAGQTLRLTVGLSS